jgi:hypothetical protein
MGTKKPAKKRSRLTKEIAISQESGRSVSCARQISGDRTAQAADQIRQVRRMQGQLLLLKTMPGMLMWKRPSS